MIQHQPLALVLSAIKRPRMYTAHGTCGEVIAFLEGYYSALGKIPPRGNEVQDWDDFYHYVGATLGEHKSLRDFAAIVSEADALTRLDELFAAWEYDLYKAIDNRNREKTLAVAPS